MIGLLKEIAEFCPKDQALLGLDVGKKTIGIALCAGGMTLATPITTIRRVKFGKDVEAIKKIVREYDVGGFVMGLPVNMDGSEGPRAQSIRDFAAEFERQIGISDPWIAFWDERLSTVSVEDFVGETVGKRKTRVNAKASGLIDKLAAQMILQGAVDYMDMN